MISTEEVTRLLLDAFPGAQVSVDDMTGTGDHFDIYIASPMFKGKSLIEQHQWVHAALSSEMDQRIHAVQIKTKVA